MIFIFSSPSHDTRITKQLEEDTTAILTPSLQTFLFLGTAEAASGFLELIAVNFDHPKRTEHLRQVGSFITVEKLDLNAEAF